MKTECDPYKRTHNYICTRRDTQRQQQFTLHLTHTRLRVFERKETGKRRDEFSYGEEGMNDKEEEISLRNRDSGFCSIIIIIRTAIHTST